jgi:FtsZ-binding cell division protein ZapB
METEMELTLEELGSIERDILDYVRNAPHFQECAPRIKACFAAARAHLETNNVTNDQCIMCGAWKGYKHHSFCPKLTPPPPQREDEITGPTGYHDSVSALLHRTGGADGDGGSPAPSSTVEPLDPDIQQYVDHLRKPSPDAGLVERLREHHAMWSKETTIFREAAAALEAKDAEIERLQKGWNFAECDSKDAQAEIERLSSPPLEQEVKHLDGQIKTLLAENERLREALDCVLKYHCPNIQSVAVDRARAALKGGD